MDCRRRRLRPRLCVHVCCFCWGLLPPPATARARHLPRPATRHQQGVCFPVCVFSLACLRVLQPISAGSRIASALASVCWLRQLRLGRSQMVRKLCGAVLWVLLGSGAHAVVFGPSRQPARVHACPAQHAAHAAAFAALACACSTHTACQPAEWVTPASHACAWPKTAHRGCGPGPATARLAAAAADGAAVCATPSLHKRLGLLPLHASRPGLPA